MTFQVPVYKATMTLWLETVNITKLKLQHTDEVELATDRLTTSIGGAGDDGFGTAAVVTADALQEDEDGTKPTSRSASRDRK